jgi:hypothetical protein
MEPVTVPGTTNQWAPNRDRRDAGQARQESSQRFFIFFALRSYQTEHARKGKRKTITLSSQRMTLSLLHFWGDEAVLHGAAAGGARR